MNVNALSNIANPYIQSLTNAAMSALNSYAGTASTAGVSSTAIPQDGSPQLSPFAQLLSTLQQLQQSNPSQYQTVTQQIATNLQTASQTAQANGNSAQAQQLSTLSTDFQNASTNNQLPNVADLAEAMGSGHHHHHHGGSGGVSSSSTSGSGSSSSGSSSGSTSSSSSSSSASGSSAQSLTQMLSAYSTNSFSSDALNPLNIIVSTLASAGVTL